MKILWKFLLKISLVLLIRSALLVHSSDNAQSQSSIANWFVRNCIDRSRILLPRNLSICFYSICAFLCWPCVEVQILWGFGCPRLAAERNHSIVQDHQDSLKMQLNVAVCREDEDFGNSSIKLSTWRSNWCELKDIAFTDLLFSSKKLISSLLIRVLVSPTYSISCSLCIVIRS